MDPETLIQKAEATSVIDVKRYPVDAVRLIDQLAVALKEALA
jgi:hypothetical protein